LVLSLFVLISWITISAFFLIPKSLLKVENIIAFFCLSMLVINLYTIPDLDFKLIQHSFKLELFICYLIQRNIIVPVILIISMNLIFLKLSIMKKIIIAIATLKILCSIELLSIWTGIKTYTGWNGYLTIIALTTLIILSIIISKCIIKIRSFTSDYHL